MMKKDIKEVMTIFRADPETFSKISDLIADDIDKFRILEEFRRIVINTYPSRILYGLLKLEFSAAGELGTLLSIKDNRTTTEALGYLIRTGIVVPIYNKSERYNFIKSFWKTIYKRSSYPIAFYNIHPDWVEFVKSIQSVLLEDYKSANPIDHDRIDERMQKYEEHCQNNLDDLKKAEDKEKNSLGLCPLCNKYIHKDSVINKDYTFYHGIKIHKECYHNKPTSLIAKLRKNG